MAVHPNVQDLCQFIEESPSPTHCATSAQKRLVAAGFQQVQPQQPWPEDQAQFICHQGMVIAWVRGQQAPVETGFRLLGAHTDSPNFRIAPIATNQKEGCTQLCVEPYGGLLSYTWFDRDLGIAGTVMHRDTEKDEVIASLIRLDTPPIRIPSLAIHLNRDIRSDGFKVNAQNHTSPILGDLNAPDFKAMLAQNIETNAEHILSWDLSLFDLQKPGFGGFDDVFIYAPRLDNQAMCHAEVVALTEAYRQSPQATSVICLYDHEEVGSQSQEGAAGSMLEHVLKRLSLAGSTAPNASFERAVAHSFQISADMAHAVHPNYSDKHDPKHRPKMNQGPVIKHNVNQRYATDAYAMSVIEHWAQDAEISLQYYSHRNDLPCGSTIGPISAAKLGIATIDLGNPMLSMHSIREQAGSEDHQAMITLLTHALTAPLPTISYR